FIVSFSLSLSLSLPLFSLSLSLSRSLSLSLSQARSAMRHIKRCLPVQLHGLALACTAMSVWTDPLETQSNSAPLSEREDLNNRSLDGETHTHRLSLSLSLSLSDT